MENETANHFATSLLTVKTRGRPGLKVTVNYERAQPDLTSVTVRPIYATFTSGDLLAVLSIAADYRVVGELRADGPGPSFLFE